ncbi:MAG TPA: lysoplasmalogenase [Spirochaetota bacterium]|nr:lysoplasmalogenase [Spirochaetota bacterium]
MFTVFLFLYLFTTSLFSVYCNYKAKKLFYVAKILPIVGLVISLFIIMIFKNKFSVFNFLILFGLLIGAVGDIFIINKKTFIFGLCAFLITHILYVVGFNYDGFSLSIGTNLLIPIISTSLIFTLFITYKMIHGEDKNLIIPVWVYVLVINLMVISSIGFTLNNNFKNYFFIIGSISFYISDAILSLKTFITKDLGILQIFILSFYYLAQSFIFLGAINI